MKNLKRLLAVIGIILLAGMYVLTFILALTDNSAAGNMIMASLYATVIIPILLYAFLLVYHWTHQKNDVIPKILGENSDVDTVIFDIGKVLVKYDWKKLLKELKYDEDTAQAVSEAVFLSEDWTESDRGVRTEEEILQSFITNNPSYEKEIRETFARMGETISVCSYTKSEKTGLQALFSFQLFRAPVQTLYKRFKISGVYGRRIYVLAGTPAEAGTGNVPETYSGLPDCSGKSRVY